MRRENRKVKIDRTSQASFAGRASSLGRVGGVSCLLFLLLAFLAVNPVSNSSVFAEEEGAANDSNIGGSVDDNSNDNTANSDNLALAANDDSNNVDIDTAVDTDTMSLTASTTTSIVGISFSPAQYYASLSPTTSTGQSAKIDITATVNVYNSGGYAVYLKSNNGADLVGTKDSSNIISGISGTNTYTYANMPVNTWGYASTVGTTVPSTANYKRIAVSGNGDKLAENTNNKITSDSKTIALSFATKINNTKPADTYSNTMLLSVVSSPLQITFTDYITNLQDMNPTICDLVSTGAEAQLKDTRDGKYYWVTKLADGKCWMTQNLALDLSTGKALTSADSDVSANWTPGYSTATTASSSTILADDTGQRSWNLGSYYIKTPNGTTSCGSKKGSLADCTTYFTSLATPTSADGNTNAHWLTGNYYSWCAATAGCKNSSNQTGSSFTSGEAVSSICPKGWKLPTSNSTAAGSFGGLINAYSITTTEKLVTSPLYFVRDGDVYQTTSSLFEGAGNFGYYWSSTAYNGAQAYILYFSSTSNIYPSSNYNRQRGFSVRCIAR